MGTNFYWAATALVEHTPTPLHALDGDAQLALIRAAWRRAHPTAPDDIATWSTDATARRTAAAFLEATQQAARAHLAATLTSSLPLAEAQRTLNEHSRNALAHWIHREAPSREMEWQDPDGTDGAWDVPLFLVAPEHTAVGPGRYTVWLTRMARALAAETTVRLANGTMVSAREDEDRPSVHIGKRSAAGAWCYTCNRTLCKDGVRKVHVHGSAWHTACPQCRATRDTTDPHNPAMVELGFATPRPVTDQRTGVAGTSSFSWAQDPTRVRTLCREAGDRLVIANEYGELFAGTAFLEMLAGSVRIESTALLGEWFS